MSTADLTELRRLVERLAVASTDAERAHWWDVHADKVAAYLPILLDELEQLRTSDVQRRADGWLDPDQAGELRALTATCSCGTSPMTYEGPEPDCPVHGAVQALNQAMAERAVWLPVIDAARALVRHLHENIGDPHGEKWLGVAGTLVDAVDALDRGVSDQ